jgi:NADH:ubiquinone oxidoreductase subunit D
MEITNVVSGGYGMNEKKAMVSDLPSFEAVLDKTCERLQDTKIRYSIRRIQEMEQSLDILEQELEAIILKKP